MRVPLTLIAVACVVCALSGPAAARSTHHHRPKCAKAKALATSTNIAAMRAAVLCLVNAQRTSRGLPALREDPRLDRSAQGWSRSMVGQGVFSHGTDFATRITAAGFDWSAAGENIATGYPTPADVVTGWMASLGHCRNILAPNFSAIGIGVVAKPVRGYASGPATWTEDFGLPMGHRAPSKNGAPAAGCPY